MLIATYRVHFVDKFHFVCRQTTVIRKQKTLKKSVDYKLICRCGNTALLMACRVRLQTCTKVHSLFKHYLNMYQELDEEAKQSNIHIADFQCIALFEQQNNFCF